MKKFAIIGWIGLIIVNASAQNIEGAFGLKLGEVYEKEVDENGAAAFTSSNPVSPFKNYKLVVVPSTKKICFITASANFLDGDKANQLRRALMRVIEKKYNAKFQKGVSNSLVHEKYVQATEKLKTREDWQVEAEEQRGESLLRNRLGRLINRQPIHHLKKGGRVITIVVYFDGVTHFLELRLTYGDENLMKSAIEEEQEKEESKINVEGL